MTPLGIMDRYRNKKNCKYFKKYDYVYFTLDIVAKFQVKKKSLLRFDKGTY